MEAFEWWIIIGAIISGCELAAALGVAWQVRRTKRALQEQLAAEKAGILKRYEQEKAAMPQIVAEAAEPWVQRIQAELLERYESEKEELTNTITAMFDEGVAVLSSKVDATLKELAPDLIDGLVSAGQGILGKRGNIAQSASKVALTQGGVDLDALLQGIDPSVIQQGMAALSQGQQPQGLPQGLDLKSIIMSMLGEYGKGLLPAKYRKLIPPGVNPLSLLSGFGAGGGSRGGNGGYSPGIG